MKAPLMPHQATLSKTWKNRQLIIGFALITLGAWFFYDGAVGFPKKNVRFHAFKELEEQGRQSEWAALADKNKWPRTIPEKEYKPVDLKGQFVLGGASTLGGLLALGLLLKSMNQNLRSDDEAIYGASGQRVPFSAITGFDRSKWDSKGIMFALYQQDGRTRRLVLDDYKFAGAELIIQQAEEHLAARQK
jgi:hypothetical protein